MTAAVCSWRWLQAAKAVLALCSALRAASPPQSAFLRASGTAELTLPAGKRPGLGLAPGPGLWDTFEPFSETGRDHTAALGKPFWSPVPGLAEPGGLECCTSRASVSCNN